MAISGSVGVEVLPVVNKAKFQAELKRQIGQINLKELRVTVTPTIHFGKLRQTAREAAQKFADEFNKAVNGKLRVGGVRTGGATNDPTVQQARKSAKKAAAAAEEEVKKQPLRISISVDETSIEALERQFREKVSEIVRVAEELDLEPQISTSLKINPTVAGSYDQVRKSMEALHRVMVSLGLDAKNLNVRLAQVKGAVKTPIQRSTTRATLGEINPAILRARFFAQAAAARQSGAQAASRVVLKVDADTKDAESKIKDAFDEIKKIAEEAGVTISGTFVDTFKKAAEPIDNTFGGKIKRIEERVNKSLGSIGLNVRNLAIIFGAGLTGDFLVAGLRIATQVTKDLFNAALQFNEAIVSTRRIFGDASEGVIEFAEDAQRSLFETRREALETANTFGLIFRRLGDDQVVADLSVAFGQLAQDFSALLGGDVSAERITGILREGLKGDLEDLGKLGILIDDTDIKIRALQEGFVGANDALTAQSRLAITAALTLEQASDVLGEAGTRAGTAAGNVALFRREFEAFKEAAGTALLPILVLIIKTITAFLAVVKPFISALSLLGEFFTKTRDKIRANDTELKKLSKTIIENAKALDQIVVTLNALSDPAFATNLLEAEIALERATIDVSNAELSLREANIAVEKSAIDTARAQVSLERANLGVQESSIALQQAELGLRREALASTKATNSLADAQQDLALILDPAHRELRLLEANLALVDAQNNVIDQVDRERDAFIALRRAQLEQFDTLEDIIRRRRRGVFRSRDVLELSLLEAEANQKVIQSLKTVERLPLDRQRADLNLRQAQQNLIRTGIDLEREERDAKLAVTEAEIAVAEAAIRSTDKRTAAELALAGAKLDVRDADLAVKDAEIAVRAQAIESERVQNNLKLAHLDVRTAIIEVGKANEEYQVLLAILNGKTLTAEERQKAFRDGIRSVAQYIKGEEAQSALSGLLTFYDDLITKQQTTIENLKTEKKLHEERAKALEKQKKEVGEIERLFKDLSKVTAGAGLFTNNNPVLRIVSQITGFISQILQLLREQKNLDFTELGGGDFASGGRFSANELIRVGEHGPEFIFTGNKEGKVINSRQTDQLPAGQTNNITIVEAQRSPEALAAAISARIGRRVF